MDYFSTRRAWDCGLINSVEFYFLCTLHLPCTNVISSPKVQQEYKKMVFWMQATGHRHSGKAERWDHSYCFKTLQSPSWSEPDVCSNAEATLLFLSYHSLPCWKIHLDTWGFHEREILTPAGGCVHTYPWVWGCINVEARRRNVGNVCCLLQSPSTLFLTQGLSLNLESPIKLNQLSIKPQGSCFCLPSTSIADVPHHSQLCMSSGDLSSCSCACMANVLPTEPPL